MLCSLALLLAIAAASGAELSSDSAALRSGFGFGSAVARQAASVPESLQEVSAAVVQVSRCVSGLQYGEILGSVLPLPCMRGVLFERSELGL